jgi:hypothetical protein
MNAHAPWNQTTATAVAVLPATSFMAAAQAVKKLAAFGCIAINPTIDGLDAHAHPTIVGVFHLDPCRNHVR